MTPRNAGTPAGGHPADSGSGPAGSDGAGSTAPRAGAAPPIFIVGTSRSGTSLLASLLGAHPAISCGPETALFLHLEGHSRAILDDPAWPDRAVRFLTELRRETASETVLAHYRLDPDRVRRALEGATPSARVLMESLTVPYMRDQGKRRWAEKTPKHLWHVAALRRLWPEAPIIRIVRDPRGVALSTRTWPFSRGAVRVAYTWLLDDEHWRAFAAGDRRTLEVRYEDLVGDPEAVMRRVCAFVGEAYDARMLAAGGPRANVVAEGEPWHHLVAGPVEPARATAWQQDLPEEDQRAVALVCGAAMTRYGYPGIVPPRAVAALHPWIRGIVRAEAALEALASAGVAAVAVDRAGARVRGRAASAASPRRTVVVGLPGETRLSRGPGSGIASLARWSVRLVLGRLGRRPVLWVPVPLDRPGRARLLDRTGDLLLRALARRVSPDRVAREIGG